MIEKARHQLVDKVTDFVESKIAILRAEIEGMISKMITPAVYYAVMVIFGFGIVITLLLLSGHFLNVWMNSDYLGYVVLLAFALLLIGVSIAYRKKFQETIRRALMNKEKV